MREIIIASSNITAILRGPDDKEIELEPREEQHADNNANSCNNNVG